MTDTASIVRACLAPSVLPDELLRGAERDDAAVVDDRDAVAEPLRLFHVVRRVEERDAPALQLADHGVDPLAGLRIDAHGGLVQQEHARVRGWPRRRC